MKYKIFTLMLLYLSDITSGKSKVTESSLIAAAILASLKDQQNAKRSTNPLQCSFCDFKAKRISSLANHLKRHTGASAHVCLCGLSYKNPKLLQNHQARVGKQRPCPLLQ